ncbi:arginine--tRNA ligase [Lewinellaceae bacterium SD302]|nr:arginine--tRNA ligase [Lewinellaceae bacterium SD302]
MTVTDLKTTLESGVKDALMALYGPDAAALPVSLQTTRKEFAGNYTVVTFPYTRVAKQKPDEIAEKLGAYLKENLELVSDYNVIKGFCNLSVADSFWQEFLLSIYENTDYGRQPDNGEKVMVEYSSPNTNKPLHLGHIRNNLLGYATARILDAAGYEVYKVQVINDRGIAICKSMLAWKKFGEGATPASTGTKPDHFVGKYYVLFEQKFKAEYLDWQSSSVGEAVYAEKAKEGQSPEAFFKAYKNTYFNEYSQLGQEAKQMLQNWEAGDEATVELWKTMNGWVYAGFGETYDRLGVDFDKLYYESNTYLLGKDIIEKGMASGTFFTKEDGSTWVDLTDAKLDEKAVLRSDGTSLYITQDLGTAQLRYQDFGVNKMVYVVADEQNYHFQVLFEILKRLGEPYAEGLHHLNYGMVDLPTGRMKSREGTVVDADDLMDEVIGEARAASADRETTSDLSAEEKERIIDQIGLAALKFFILKVNPKKRMVFDPKESVDMQGQTGPYVQNAYVRTQAVARKAGERDLSLASQHTSLESGEVDLINQLYTFPSIIEEAAENYDPSVVATYCYELAKAFHKFWHDYSILSAESEATISFRLALCKAVGNVLRTGMNLIGIDMPDRM